MQPLRIETDVLPDEHHQIATRRSVAGTRPLSFDADDSANEKQTVDKSSASDQVASPANATDSVPKNVVGLAISGGGVRSAAFGLGFLQAMYTGGVLRFVDYVSSVSGGSYVGTFLSTFAINAQSAMVWDRSPQDEAKQRSTESVRRHDRSFDFDKDLQGRQPELIRRLIAGGNYLRRPGTLFAHWLPGFLAVNLVGVSALVCLCALLAWVYRFPDTRSVMHSLRYVGFSDDVMRAFAPTAALFAVWCLMMVGGALREFLRKQSDHSHPSRVTKSVKRLTIGLLISAVLSAVSLLGLGNIDTSTIQERLQLDLSTGVKESFSRAFAAVLYALVAIGILPYVNPWAMLRSGTNPKRPRDRYLFHVATYALGCGVPLIVFMVLSSENISFSNKTRHSRHLLTPCSFTDWDDFWSLVLAGGASTSDEGAVGGDERKPGDVAPPVEKLKSRLTNLWSDRHVEEPSHWRRVTSSLARVVNATARQMEAMGVSREIDAGFQARSRTLSDAVQGEGLLYEDARGFRESLAQVGLERLPVITELLKEQRRDLESTEKVLDLSLFDRWGWFLGISSHDAHPKESVLESCEASDLRAEAILAIANYAWLNARDLHADFKNAKPFFRDQSGEVAPEGETKRANSEAQLGDFVKRAAALEPPWAGMSEREVRESEEEFERQCLRDVEIAVLRYLVTKVQGAGRREEVVEKLAGLEKDREEADAARSSQVSKYRRKLAELNRAILQTYFGSGVLVDEDQQIFAYNVQPADQRTRLFVTVTSLGVFLFVGLLVNLNGTSLHGFYRECLASQWVMRAGDSKVSDIPLAGLDTTREGAPYLLINGAMTMVEGTESNHVSDTENFLFSARWCGSEKFGFARTEDLGRDGLTLGDAMAVSGGAVTPTVSRNLAVRALLWLGNFRLGQWLPNPAMEGQGERPWVFLRPVWRRPSPLFLLRSRLFLPQEERDFHFVSDGGLHENLGIESLLLRRCRLIIAIDAGVDPDAQFSDFVKLAFRMRVEQGIEFTSLDGGNFLDLESLAPSRTESSPSEPTSPGSAPKSTSEQANAATTRGDARRHFVVLKICYPESKTECRGESRPDEATTSDEAYLILVRPSFTGDEPDELRTYRRQNSEFPQDATVDQFFEPERFEAYRFLGEHIGEELARRFTIRKDECRFRLRIDGEDHGFGSGELHEEISDAEAHSGDSTSEPCEEDGDSGVGAAIVKGHPH